MPKLVPGCLAAVVMIAATLALAAPPSESSEQNVRESEQYERLLCTNAAFRQKRIAQPEEIAEAVMFFLSRRSDYITGQVLSVSGGLTMVD